MKFTDFETTVKTKYPKAHVSPHGAYTNGATKNSVGISFTPDGRVYDYRGSYEAVLDKLGISRNWHLRDYHREKPYFNLISTHWTQGEAEAALEERLTFVNSRSERESTLAWGGTWTETTRNELEIVYVR